MIKLTPFSGISRDASVPSYMDKLVERETATRSSLVAAPAPRCSVLPDSVGRCCNHGQRVCRIPLAFGRQPGTKGVPRRGAERRIGSPLARRLRVVEVDGRPEGPRRSLAQPAAGHRLRARRDDDPGFAGISPWRSGTPRSADGAGSDVQALSAALDAEEAKPRQRETGFRRFTGWSASDIGEVRISAIWALGASGEPAVAAKLQPLRVAGRRHPQDGGAAPSALPGDAQLATLPAVRCRTRCPTCAGTRQSRLARHGNREGVPVLRQMLRSAVRRADRQAGVSSGHRRGSRGGRDDQRLARRGVAERRCPESVGRQPEPARSEHEGATGGDGSTEGDGVSGSGDLGDLVMHWCSDW